MLCCPAVLANAAVARSFSGYFASLINKVRPLVRGSPLCPALPCAPAAPCRAGRWRSLIALRRQQWACLRLGLCWRSRWKEAFRPSHDLGRACFLGTAAALS